MAENLFSRLTAEEKRRALDLDDFFLQSVLQSRHTGAVVAGIGVEEELALAAKMSDEDIRQAIEIVEWHKQAMAASEAAKHQTAIECFEKIVRQAPFDAISWMSLGVQHAFLQNGRKAVECLERALEEDPDNERIRGNLEAVRADFGIDERTLPRANSQTVTGGQPLSNTLQRNSTTSELVRHPANTSRKSGPLRIEQLARLAAQRRWQEPDLARDSKNGSHKCDLCPAPIPVDSGYLIGPAPIRKPQPPSKVPPKMKELNSNLQPLWKSMNYSTAQCDRCGLLLGAGSSGWAGVIGGLGAIQNNSQGLGAALRLLQIYFDEEFTPSDNPLFASTGIENFCSLTECERCKSQLCRRCRKLQHAPERCVFCSETRSPRLVCKACFAKRGKESESLRGLLAIWAGHPDSVEPTKSDTVLMLASAMKIFPKDIAISASGVLRSLKNDEAIDTLAALWNQEADARLENLIRECAYVASQPTDLRIKTALLQENAAALLADDSAEVIEQLLRSASHESLEHQARVAQIIKTIRRPDARNRAWSVALELGNAIAIDAVLASGHAPDDIDQRALFFFLTRQWAAYQEIDPGRDKLQGGIERAQPELRTRIQKAAEQGRRLEWVQCVLGGPKMTLRERVSDDEWSAIHGLLISARRWAECWILARRIPLRWSLEFLKSLSKSGWRPEPQYRAQFDALIPQVRDLDSSAWSVSLSSRLARLEGVGRISSVAISPDLKHIAVSSERGGVRLYSIKNSTTVKTLESTTSENRNFRSLTFSRCEKFLVGVECQNQNRFQAAIWSLETERCSRISDPLPSDRIVGADDGLLLVLREDSIQGYNIRTTDPTTTFETSKEYRLSGHTGGSSGCFLQVIVATEKGWVIGISDRGECCLWELQGGEHLKSWQVTKDGHGLVAAVTPDGKQLVTHSKNGTLQVWSLRDGRLLQKWEIASSSVSQATEIQVTRDGSTALLRFGPNKQAKDGDSIRALAVSLESGKRRFQLQATSSAVHFTPDGRWLIAADGANLRILSVVDGATAAVLQGNEGRIGHLAVAENSQFVVTGCDQGRVLVWDLRGLQLGIIKSLPVNRLQPAELRMLEEIAKDDSLPSNLQSMISAASAFAKSFGRPLADE